MVHSTTPKKICLALGMFSSAPVPCEFSGGVEADAVTVTVPGSPLSKVVLGADCAWVTVTVSCPSPSVVWLGVACA